MAKPEPSAEQIYGDLFTNVEELKILAAHEEANKENEERDSTFKRKLDEAERAYEGVTKIPILRVNSFTRLYDIKIVG